VSTVPCGLPAGSEKRGAVFVDLHRSAERLKREYWLYAVFNCGEAPELNTVQDQARLDWRAVAVVEHYPVKPDVILAAREA